MLFPSTEPPYIRMLQRHEGKALVFVEQVELHSPSVLQGVPVE